MRIVLDTKRCIGAAACVMAADQIFDIDDEEGVVKLIRQPRPDEAKQVRAAATACPTGAIEIVEE